MPVPEHEAKGAGQILEGHQDMASVGTITGVWGLRAEPPAGSRGRAPGQKTAGILKHEIFSADEKKGGQNFPKGPGPLSTPLAPALLRLHFVRLSVFPSVCDVGGSGSHRLEILETSR